MRGLVFLLLREVQGKKDGWRLRKKIKQGKEGSQTRAHEMASIFSAEWELRLSSGEGVQAKLGGNMASGHTTGINKLCKRGLPGSFVDH